MSYLYMLTGIFGAFAVVVAVLGFRGQKSDARPWHFFLDMKYQPKYTSQGQSRFFADGRSNRLPPEGTIPFDGTDYTADAGRHAEPEPGLPEGRPALLLRRRQPDASEGDAGRRRGARQAEVEGRASSPAKGTSSNHIPHAAVEKAGGWEPLIKRGRQQFTVHCAVCHGASGRGGGGDDRLRHRRRVRAERRRRRTSLAPAMQAQPDGQLFNTITNGVRHDAGLRPPGEGAGPVGDRGLRARVAVRGREPSK